jgi:hypothetical protein
MAEGYLFLIGILSYLVLDGFDTKKTGITFGVATPKWEFDRAKQPVAYWLVMAAQIAFLIFCTDKLLDYIPD